MVTQANKDGSYIGKNMTKPPMKGGEDIPQVPKP